MDRETRPRRASQVVHDDYVMWTHLRVPGVGFAGFRDGDFCAIEEPSQPIDLITPTVSSAKNYLVCFSSIGCIDHPVWRGHREEAKSGPPCEHRITRNEGAMVPLLLPRVTTGLASIAAWCGRDTTPRGQPW